jgi:hypothetical protein
MLVIHSLIKTVRNCHTKYHIHEVLISAKLDLKTDSKYSSHSLCSCAAHKKMEKILPGGVSSHSPGVRGIPARCLTRPRVVVIFIIIISRHAAQTAGPGPAERLGVVNSWTPRVL